jgi:2-polyprenyl-6-methoxyphenol hydroxylase-like FAD-dependent oxidoreductase
MSPVGGVGINLAIQDAVAAANILAGPLAEGSLDDDLLERVCQRRLWPAKVTQFLQVQIQNRIIAPILGTDAAPPKQPLALRIVAKVPWLQRRVASLIGLGVRPEHIRSPDAFQLSERNAAASIPNRFSRE